MAVRLTSRFFLARFLLMPYVLPPPPSQTQVARKLVILEGELERAEERAEVAEL